MQPRPNTDEVRLRLGRQWRAASLNRSEPHWLPMKIPRSPAYWRARLGLPDSAQFRLEISVHGPF